MIQFPPQKNAIRTNAQGARPVALTSGHASLPAVTPYTSQGEAEGGGVQPAPTPSAKPVAAAAASPMYPDLPAEVPGGPAPKSHEIPLLSVDTINVRYGLVPALRGVSIEIRPGEMIALLGANGAGKTTTLRAISGLVSPTSGEILYQGKRIDGMSPSKIVRLGIAQMPEGRDLFPQLSVQENLRFGYLIHRKDRKGYHDQLDEVYLGFPKLKDRRRQAAGTLSGGEQQMLTAGIALMSRPKLLLVDELSLGLAPLIVAQLFAVLREVNRRGTAILLVEQFVPLALANTTRAYVLARGEVAMSRASAELKDDPGLIASYLGSAAGGEHAGDTNATQGGGSHE